MIQANETEKKEKIQLKISLKETKPSVWRRVHVPLDFSLGELHDVIQAVMPWDDCHLHEFVVGKKYYGVPEPECGDEVLDEEEVTIGEVFRGKRKRIEYVYDFGDGWEHGVEYEGRVKSQKDVEYPHCVEGENACPPEDSGSVFGYYDKLSILMDPSHPEHESVKEWMPEDFNARHFSVEEANELLRWYDEPDPAVEDLLQSCRWCGAKIAPGESFACAGLKLRNSEGLVDLLEFPVVVLEIGEGGERVVADVAEEGSPMKADGNDVAIPVCSEACLAELDAALKESKGKILLRLPSDAE